MRALSALALPLGCALLLTSCHTDVPVAAAADPIGARLARADSLRERGEFAAAAALYRRVRDSLAASADSVLLWEAHYGWADALMRQAKLDSAGAALDDAFTLAGTNRGRLGRAVLLESRIAWRRGLLDDAERSARVALGIARDLGDHELAASAYTALGTIHSHRGEHLRALDVHERLLELRRRSGAGRDIALALNEIGIDYRHLGRFEDALAAYEEALGIYSALEEVEGVAMVLYNLANVHRDAGEPRHALRRLRSSLERAEQIGHVRGSALIHSGMADLLAEATNLSAARRHLERALEINREAGLPYGEVVALEQLGQLELAAGRPEAASVALSAARALADSLGYGDERASTRVALARLEAARGAGSAALRWAREAVAIADGSGDPAARYDALTALGEAREAARRGDALEPYLAAIAILESWRGRLALEALRVGVVEPRRDAYEGAIRVLLAERRAEEAFEIAERARARRLLELVSAPGAASVPRSPWDSLHVRVRQRHAALSGAPESERLRIEEELERSIAALDSLQRAERARGGPGAAARFPAPASFEDVRTRLTGARRAVLAYFWGERDVYGWWIDAHGARAARLGAADTLAAFVDFLREALADPHSDVDWRASARRGFLELVAPLAPGAAPTLSVLADGPLAHIPLEVLIPPEETRPWTAARRIAYGPSASVLLALARAPPPGDSGPAVLAVGDPALRSVGGGDTLPPLPHAREEARAVARLFRAEGAEVLTGRRATLERWLSRRPERFRYLHFAAHALIDDRRPEHTRVLLAGAPLDLATVRGLRLNAEIVTLSACDSGLGRQRRGEGVIGLPHAFLAAGARAVLATLWRVDDRAAARFMTAFYDELRAGRAPADALHRVRRAHLAEDGQAAHPSRWAPYVLVGVAGGSPAAAAEQVASDEVLR